MAVAQAASISYYLYGNLCGSDYSPIDSQDIGDSVVWLAWNGYQNCAVTLKPADNQQENIGVSIGLYNQPYSGEDSGNYFNYAGPVYSPPSAQQCITWVGFSAGGYFNSISYHPSRSHCG